MDSPPSSSSSTFWPPPPLTSPPSQPFIASPLQVNNLTPPPPSFPDIDPPHEDIDLSPLAFVLALLALVTIPALLYTFFFSLKCNFSSPSRQSASSSVEENDRESNPDNNPDVVSGVKFQKDSHVKEIGSECPVCLSVFADGEEIKKLSVCKHSFHASCIDEWLNSRGNCPVCRAPVPVKRPPASAGDGGNNNRVPSRSRRDNDDLHQGLPDAANMV